MVIWIVLGAVLLGLIILALAVRAVLARLPRLRRALLVLLRRQAEVAALQTTVDSLQDRLRAVQSQAELAQRSVAVIQARRRAD